MEVWNRGVPVPDCLPEPHSAGAGLVRACSKRITMAFRVSRKVEKSAPFGTTIHYGKERVQTGKIGRFR